MALTHTTLLDVCLCSNYMQIPCTRVVQEVEESPLDVSESPSSDVDTLEKKPLSGFEVHVLRSGNSSLPVNGYMKALSTFSIVKGPGCCILVDTGSPWDQQVLLASLHSFNVQPHEVDHVVCTHGHVDHVGNLNLFPKARILVGTDCVQLDGNTFACHDYNVAPYEICESVRVLATPGHTLDSVSVMVEGTPLGTVALVGDLFECEEDLERPELWQVMKLVESCCCGGCCSFPLPSRTTRLAWRDKLTGDERFWSRSTGLFRATALPSLSKVVIVASRVSS